MTKQRIAQHTDWLQKTNDQLAEIRTLLVACNADNSIPELTELSNTVSELVQCVHCSLLQVHKKTMGLSSNEMQYLESMVAPEVALLDTNAA